MDFLAKLIFSSVQLSSVTQSCPTLCDPMNHSMPSLPVHHQLPEFTQTHVHQVSDAIQPSHPAEYIMRNAGLEETQAGIKIAGRNISNLR